MDILLTHAYFLHDDRREIRIMKPYAPLGILHLSAYLKARGYQVGVFDSTFQSLADFTALLSRERPRAIGIYGNLTMRPRLLQMMAAAKAAGAVVILGGPEPANYADEYLDRGADVIVFGEGECALDELLPALAGNTHDRLNGVCGIAFRRDDGTHARTPTRPVIEDLDSLPDPDREAIAMGQYLTVWRNCHGLTSVSLLCARGCPYSCSWCSRAVFGQSHRRRSPGRVAQEVARLVECYKPDQLWYADDVFTISSPWLREFSRELSRRGLRVPFECMSRADRLDEDVILLLAEMGCCRIWLGSESGSQRILDAMRRGVRVEQLRSVSHALRRKGIQVGMFVMLGYEGEEIRDIEETVDHLKRSSPDLFLATVSYPVKGTEYFQQVENRLVIPADWQGRTDRDLGVRGRHSRRFYSFATRWMVSSVALSRDGMSGRHLLGAAKAAAGILVGRLGMWMTRHEMEGKRLQDPADDRRSVPS